MNRFLEENWCSDLFCWKAILFGFFSLILPSFPKKIIKLFMLWYFGAFQNMFISIDVEIIFCFHLVSSISLVFFVNHLLFKVFSKSIIFIFMQFFSFVYLTFSFDKYCLAKNVAILAVRELHTAIRIPKRVSTPFKGCFIQINFFIRRFIILITFMAFKWF